jgi:hypothetical protein
MKKLKPSTGRLSLLALPNLKRPRYDKCAANPCINPNFKS